MSIEKYGLRRIVSCFFYRWGHIVASHPLIVIFASLLFTGICCIGLLRWK
jgi:uncharacterized membrane protein YdfJ with MMPL/SSD domain